jgi:hypothetical protein
LELESLCCDLPDKELSLEYLQGLMDGVMLSRKAVMSGQHISNMSEDDVRQVELAFDYLKQRIEGERSTRRWMLGERLKRRVIYTRSEARKVWMISYEL